MVTRITPWSSQSVKLAGTRTRRLIIGLIPVSQILTSRIAVASAASVERLSFGTGASAVVSFGQISACRAARPRLPAKGHAL
jgi:hypothetical protein